MRVSGRALVLGFLVAVCAPAAASAAPILATGSAGGSCAGIVGATTANCSVFDLSFSEIMSGQFEFDNDVALFRFTLLDEVLFSAATSSYEDGTNFDPSLGLFRSDGQIVTTPDPDGSDARFPALGTDIDGANYNDQLALTLGPGSYLLALYKFPNGARIDEITGIDSLLAGFQCDAPGACDVVPGGSLFSFSVTSTPVDGNAPIPEPTTLALFGGGGLAALIRRRAKTRAHAEFVSR